ncbi:MAG: hypothetical protein Q7U98_05195 [Methylicorpusculum sp.]|uniref:hypothetical protein n=1 Tax=Methylicorpusculum sp. TaxID=2713644 RepID=UPI002721B049|nr:hypothetical protein [Methylicorpusculum sp.]MDO8938533.1 hypothetical protein [Methylicorpusculum sp.]MDO9239204.1 hypothetical protein [Methylicorpusculum sp.]MDP2202083.1 hypothetical protein [Methylicorpusculum sp.]
MIDAIEKKDNNYYRLIKKAPELVLELSNLNYTNCARDNTFRIEEIKLAAFFLAEVLTPPQNNLSFPVIMW